MDSTKSTFGSAKEKATETTQDAQGMTQEKINKASESTKKAAGNARQKFNQATENEGWVESSPFRRFPPQHLIHPFQVETGFH